MTNKLKAFIAVAGLLIVGLLCAGAAPGAPYPPGYSSSQVTHVEHTGPRINTLPGNCVRSDFTTAKDAGAFLSGEPDAALGYPFAGPDAATWAPGADAAVWVPPDATVMGPRPLPKVGLNYECTARTNSACLKQGMAIDSCNYTKFLPADQPTAPFAFMPEPDGGQPKVFGVGSGGTTSVECCPVLPSVMSGN